MVDNFKLFLVTLKSLDFMINKHEAASCAENLITSFHVGIVLC